MYHSGLQVSRLLLKLSNFHGYVDERKTYSEIQVSRLLLKQLSNFHGHVDERKTLYNVSTCKFNTIMFLMQAQ